MKFIRLSHPSALVFLEHQTRKLSKAPMSGRMGYVVICTCSMRSERLWPQHCTRRTFSTCDSGVAGEQDLAEVIISPFQQSSLLSFS